MAMKIDGKCHCGKVAYEAEIDPEKVGICHCTDCQAMSASAFRTVAFATAGNLRLLHGEPREYVKVADSGNRRVQAFCSDCGSALYATNADGDRKAYSIRLGTARQRNELAPRFECWTDSALPWVSLHPETRKFKKRPSLD